MLFETALADFVAPVSLFLIDAESSSTNSFSLNLFSPLFSGYSDNLLTSIITIL